MASTVLIELRPSLDKVHFNTINGAIGDISQTGLDESASPTDCIKAHLKLVISLVIILSLIIRIFLG